MNDERYYFRLIKAFACFAALYLSLILLALLTHACVDAPRPLWLEVGGGTLTFPTLAYAGMEVGTPDSKSPIHFRWWTDSPFESSPLVWCINLILWSAFLAWAYCSNQNPKWIFGATLLLTAIAFSFTCYLLYATIEYSTEWRDFISVFGTIATMLAFAITIKQAGDAKRAAQSAEVAVKKTAKLYSSNYFAYAMPEAKRLYSLARQHQNQALSGDAQQWQLAAAYFRMTAEVLEGARGASPPSIASDIASVISAIHRHTSECDRMGTIGKNLKKTQWDALEKEFTKLVFNVINPIPQQVPHAEHQ